MHQNRKYIFRKYNITNNICRLYQVMLSSRDETRWSGGVVCVCVTRGTGTAEASHETPTDTCCGFQAERQGEQGVVLHAVGLQLTHYRMRCFLPTILASMTNFRCVVLKLPIGELVFFFGRWRSVYSNKTIFRAHF